VNLLMCDREGSLYSVHTKIQSTLNLPPPEMGSTNMAYPICVLFNGTLCCSITHPTILIPPPHTEPDTHNLSFFL
jgi:hypothetical protein